MSEAVLLLVLVFISIIIEVQLIQLRKYILVSGVSEKEKKEIVNTHNDLRLLLARGKVRNQPIATNMRALCWDDHLARTAQKMADEMMFQHRWIDDDRWDHVGQNLAEKSLMRNRMGTEWPWAISTWFNEVQYYTYGDMPIGGTGHYTQVAWAKTTHVGCGYTHYVNPADPFKFKKLYICNYGPGGNVAGIEPYKTGRCGCKGLCRPRCKPFSNKTRSRNKSVAKLVADH